MRYSSRHPVGLRSRLQLGLAVAIIALVVAVAWCGGRVEAQDLALSDFDDTGVETDVLALMTKGADGDSIYRSSASPPATGSLLSGELGLGDGDVAICRIRVQEQGATLRIHDCDPFSLANYFGAGGAGSDLTLRVQTSAGGTGTGTIDTARLGAGFAAFDLDDDATAILNGLPVGTNYIIALVRDLPVDPTQVTGVGATADDYDSITVTWNAPTDADSYFVHWDTDSSFGDATEAVISSGSTVTYQITGLQEDTTYYVRVYAFFEFFGVGTSSSSVSATTDLQPPGQVSGVSLTVDSDTEIAVSWTAALRADGYRVEWGTTSGTYTGSAATTATSYTVTGLTYSTTYYVRVVATRTGADDGTPSDEESDATQVPPTPGQVSGVGATADDHDSITVTWSAATDADGYVVQWDTDSAFGSPSEADISSGSTVTYRITGLQEDTTYHVRVYATRTGASDGTPSDSVSATTELQPPGQVSGVSLTVDSDVAITVSWSPALRADGYRVEWGTTSGAYTGSAATTATSHTVTGLTYSTTYYVRVVATRTGADDGAPSRERGATTEAAPTLGQVTGVDATGTSDSEIEVEWDAAQHATGYIVEWDTSATFDAPDQASVIGTRAIIERLKASTEYFVRVAATRAGAANGAKSAADTATTETARLMVWADRVPGGAVGAQLGLAVFGGVFAGFRFRTMKTPRREALILLCMCAASLLLPLFGVGNLFWTGGIVLLAAASSAAVFFLASRA